MGQYIEKNNDYNIHLSFTLPSLTHSKPCLFSVRHICRKGREEGAGMGLKRDGRARMLEA